MIFFSSESQSGQCTERKGRERTKEDPHSSQREITPEGGGDPC